MRTQRAHYRHELTPPQRHLILARAVQLPPDKRHSFTIRVEAKLAMRRRDSITDGLIAQIISNVLGELGAT